MYLLAERFVFDNEIEFEVAVRTALVKVGRSDDRSFTIDQHDFCVKYLVFDLTDLYFSPKKCAVITVSKKPDHRDITAYRQQKAHPSPSSGSP
jgi:hypothetical protein